MKAMLYQRNTDRKRKLLNIVSTDYILHVQVDILQTQLYVPFDFKGETVTDFVINYNQLLMFPIVFCPFNFGLILYIPRPSPN